MRQRKTIRNRRSMLKLLGLAAVGATAGVVTGRVIDVAGNGEGAGAGGADGAGGTAGTSAGNSAGSAAMSGRSQPPSITRAPDMRPVLLDSASPSRLRMAYGPDPRQFGDLHLPPELVEGAPDELPPAASRPIPLVVMIHGGGWMDSSTLDNASHQADDLAAAGVAVWNIEYRGTGGAGGWPRTYQDVAAAIDAIPHVAGLSTVPLDLGRVAVTGVSAGGSLAAWAANRSALPDGAPGADPVLPIRNCVAMCGVYDLARAFRWGDPFIRPLLGGTPEQFPDRYRHTGPIARFAPGVRTVILHGRNDTVVEVQQAISYEAAARRARRPVVMRLFDDASHGSWGDLAGPQWRAAKDALLGLLR
ncbi:alpha/beta hydrolase family protein [Corynebacterium sp. NPDC060344]|uniref:alpha/beta hydrolase family protein n=1 Tax=Corynebacterium sp. NPDC060344 TaxID=3347101 RepID=UPI00364A70A0